MSSFGKEKHEDEKRAAATGRSSTTYTNLVQDEDEQSRVTHLSKHASKASQQDEGVGKLEEFPPESLPSISSNNMIGSEKEKSTRKATTQEEQLRSSNNINAGLATSPVVDVPARNSDNSTTARSANSKTQPSVTSGAAPGAIAVYPNGIPNNNRYYQTSDAPIVVEGATVYSASTTEPSFIRPPMMISGAMDGDDYEEPSSPAPRRQFDPVVAIPQKQEATNVPPDASPEPPLWSSTTTKIGLLLLMVVIVGSISVTLAVVFSSRPTTPEPADPVFVYITLAPSASPSAAPTPILTSAPTISDVQIACTWFDSMDASGACANLQSLTSSASEGSIPTEIGALTQLTELTLEASGLTGPIPATLGSLTELIWLNLASNSLTGDIPSSLENLTQLTTLRLFDNALSGSIPSSLGRLSKLVTLFLQDNFLTGTIPSTLSDLLQMEYLSFGANELTSSIPSFVGDFAQLTGLWLYTNMLTGSIPSTIGSLTKLRTLSLRANSLTGSISSAIADLSQLNALSLEENELTGAIPAFLSNLTDLNSLHLHVNSLTGTIPSSLVNLTALTSLSLRTNRLNGSIPPSLGSLTQLDGLWLHTNMLTGSIPPSLSRLTLLTRFLLYTNNLTGSIPSDFSDLTELDFLYLYNTYLSGTIPLELCAIDAAIQIDCVLIECSCCMQGPTGGGAC